jgi:hypothetical protein
MPGQRDQAGEVLAFWFVETRPRQWFAKDAAFDGLVRNRFLGLTRQALAGELDAWSMEPSGGLALVLLLDQFPRQIWRDTALAFAGDPQALVLSLKAVERYPTTIWLRGRAKQVDRSGGVQLNPVAMRRAPGHACSSQRSTDCAVHVQTTSRQPPGGGCRCGGHFGEQCSPD